MITRLYQTVAEELQRRIRTGVYKVGDRLDAERVLAEQFNVSRPTIREAIIALEILGLVEVRKGSGVHVIATEQRDDAPEELDIGPFELMEARRHVEGEAAYLAASRITDETLSKLKKHLDSINSSKQIKAAESADREFHILIAEASNNSAMVKMVEYLWSIRDTSPMLIEMLNRSRDYGVAPMIEDHQNILTALEQRSPDKARAAMVKHLSNVIDALLEVSEIEEVERARASARERRAHFLGAQAV